MPRAQTQTLPVPALSPASSGGVVEISPFLYPRHLRAGPNAHVLYYKAGELRRSGRGLAFWFLPLGASLAVVPLDDREQSVQFRARSADFQELTVNASVLYRVFDPEQLAGRVDFAVDSRSGAYAAEPLDRLATVITQLARQITTTWLDRRTLAVALESGAPVVPFAAAGVDDTFEIVGRRGGFGRWWMGHDKYDVPRLRGRRGWPVPRAVPIHFRVGEPMYLSAGPVADPSAVEVHHAHAAVWSAAQSLVDETVADWRARHGGRP